ncbi:tetratricopeptide repeat protein [Psychrobacter sp. NG27]|uniref:tetratricopeptide repeat protein n=1 Tax=Psychrobacter sp. NG27 TaxID=2781966 RepID=UPI0018DF117C|nr:DUF2971 domain-containing protein [Psychrobacter sp. NG27]MBI0426105.1 DUF2971 domain-containing protein [Psychrobacter sp. NG27]
MNIDDIEGLDEATRKKIEELRQVTREKDGSDNFAKAQFNIGIILAQNNNVLSALSVWESIKYIDNAKVYAYTQLNMGMALANSDQIDLALARWRNINFNDASNLYANAQLNIGTALQEKGDTSNSLLAWGSIKHTDNAEIYAQAQFNIGLYLYKNANTEKGLSILRNISDSDNPRIYAKAQYILGLILKKEKDLENALRTLCNISFSDDPKIYAQAELSIGWLLEDIGSPISVLEAWSRVKREDNKEAYATAQFCTGSHHAEHESMEDAINAWKKIRHSDDSLVYARAQYEIGQHFINDHVSKKYEEAQEAFINADSAYSYETYCYSKICDLIKNTETESFGLSALSLLNLVLKIASILTLDFKQYADEEKPFERKLAHYTSTYISNLLLSNDKKNSSPSLFRLNTINNVNDPSEGQLLIRKLKGVKDNKFAPLDFNEEYHAFISCFTFNHDSLNQFRLYGKQDNKEASGVSLVFKKEFFQSDSSIGGLSYLSFENTPKFVKTSSNLNNEEFYDTQIQEPENENQEIVRRSVMRCVYLDPSSDYFHLAQRNRLTFFREFGDKIVTKNGKQKFQAEYEWGIYQEYIKIITDEFETAYENLKTTYKEVEAEINNVRFILGSLKQKELNTLLDEILLPLKYLIKHSAFREEQECRIIYITSIDRPKVTMEYGSFLYVEYEPSVKDHLDKIYMAPAALHHKRYFDHILKDIDVPVEVSGNVFR